MQIKLNVQKETCMWSTFLEHIPETIQRATEKNGFVNLTFIKDDIYKLKRSYTGDACFTTV